MPELTERRRLEVGGRVQGVGFRPFVARLAQELSLRGLVGNDSRGAFIEVQGSMSALDVFMERLQSELPPLAEIFRLHASVIPLLAQRAHALFEIVPSQRGEGQDVEITPDATTCVECLQELHDPDDRRWRYAFINCTNCGPRYSIIEGVPYDRPKTTMAAFSMCERCQGEYDDLRHRRYHAQPNACACCGPRVWLTDAQGREVETDDAVATCADRLSSGEIVAIKGLGGFHLACRADDEAVVRELRARKGREAKPLAVMVSSIEQAHQVAEISSAAAAALLQPARPIVLVPHRPGTNIAPSVAAQSDALGLMLPYTPLHELLLTPPCPPLVMTSGNPSEEPLSSSNDEALKRLGHIADAFLLHDRAIARPIDDSVLMIPDDEDQPPMVVRRARGYVPASIAVEKSRSRDTSDAPTIFALGGDLKSTVCLLRDGQAVLSEHLGDLENPAAFRNFIAAGERLLMLLRAKPQQLVCDLHPAYHSRAHAQALGLPLIEVQHHHAHAVSCMAEHQLTGRVVAICADGTGYGGDGAIWGGEILLCDERDYQRVGQLRYVPLFGGDRAARETWRPALGHVVHALEGVEASTLTHFAGVISPQMFKLALTKLPSAPLSSSLGRLFDSVAFLLQVGAENQFEGQAAIHVENLARSVKGLVTPLVFGLEQDEHGWQMDSRPMIRALLQRQAHGEDAAALALAFHDGVGAVFAEAAARAAQSNGISRVVLSGGCMLNRLLVTRLTEHLRASGLEVYAHSKVPPGDGGLALGQAVIAAARRSH
ncbi:MAG: carbamoyltransferase HypF [Deltaproteobacteria bacterium]|nr:carbamoyltransferase HypF [Deltaproteobacteria bacterium]